eukprot:6158050-Pyramimonas_sp.AAC.1
MGPPTAPPARDPARRGSGQRRCPGTRAEGAGGGAHQRGRAQRSSAMKKSRRRFSAVFGLWGPSPGLGA